MANGLRLRGIDFLNHLANVIETIRGSKVNVLRVPIVALATTAAIAVASPIAAGAARPASHAAVAATRDDNANLQLFLQRLLQKHPRVTRAALARVKSRPLFFQYMYVSGAIAVTSAASPPGVRREMCTLVKSDPARLEAAARTTLRPSELAYIQSKGWTVGSVARTYRLGVVFGCGLRPE